MMVMMMMLMMMGMMMMMMVMMMMMMMMSMMMMMIMMIMMMMMGNDDSNGCWLGNWCQDKSEGGCSAPQYGSEMASGYGLSERATVMERAGKTGKSKLKARIVCYMDGRCYYVIGSK